MEEVNTRLDAQHVHARSCVTACSMLALTVLGCSSLCAGCKQMGCRGYHASPITCRQATLTLKTCWLQANEMARRVLADTETSEGDLAPAPKLLEIILQNCRGRVDHCVAPYLQVGGSIHGFWCWL